MFIHDTCIYGALYVNTDLLKINLILRCVFGKDIHLAYIKRNYHITEPIWNYGGKKIQNLINEGVILYKLC